MFKGVIKKLKKFDRKISGHDDWKTYGDDIDEECTSDNNFESDYSDNSVMEYEDRSIATYEEETDCYPNIDTQSGNTYFEYHSSEKDIRIVGPNAQEEGRKILEAERKEKNREDLLSILKFGIDFTNSIEEHIEKKRKEKTIIGKLKKKIF